MEMLVYDFETTGFSWAHNEIIEVAAAKVDENFNVLETYDSLIKPEKPIPEEITKVTGIKNDTVRNAKGAREVMQEFRKFCDKHIMIAHNGLFFDAPFYYSQLRRCQLGLPDNVMWDSLHIAKYYATKAKKHNMKYLCEFYNIKQESAHRALSDVKDLCKLLQIWREKHTLEQMEAAAKPCELKSLETFRCRLPFTLSKFASAKKFCRVKGQVKGVVREVSARPIFAFKKKKEAFFLVREEGGDRIEIAIDGLEVIDE